ncbi:hypothetical protein CRE_06784 [Caenorhabditis remanei]|uniref:Uncharacterized protein n=1 Tax=Caenorhabditis remanei TaxID=31234 RepID=E3MNT3_CAERE|nr:hypothetical protein CRE_06784 [Caenorhabditis remanei]
MLIELADFLNIQLIKTFLLIFVASASLFSHRMNRVPFLLKIFSLFKFDRLLNYGKPQFETSLDDSTRSKYANLCVEVLVAIGAAVKNAQKITAFFDSQNLKVSKIWMTRIPEIFEKITNAYDYPTCFGVAMNLFSLAPILSDRPPSPPVDEQAELRARALAYRSFVLSKLQKIRSAQNPTSSTDASGKIAVDAENLVPMATSKKYSALNSLKISEADKVAIRPTYDKYRYETPNSDEEGNGRGVYDDEYDDEFDGREFKMERLNQELETSSEEDEPIGASSGPPGLSGQPKIGNQSRGVSSGGHRGGRGPGGGGRGGTTTSGASTMTSSEGYTGGRDRQMKERHKSDHKQRGADRKKRGAY